MIFPRVGRVLGDEELEERGFADPARPDDGELVPAIEVELEVVDDFDVTEALGELLDAEDVDARRLLDLELDIRPHHARSAHRNARLELLDLFDA